MFKKNMFKINSIKEMKLKNHNWIFIAFIALFLVATLKYVIHGEGYIFSTPVEDQFIDINVNSISQDIIIDEKAKWNDKSFAVYFQLESENSKKGIIHLELKQDEKVIDSCDVPVEWLTTGFNELKWLKFSKLHSGQATVIIQGKNLEDALSIGICGNIYNLPDCYSNAEDTGGTLVAKYHYNYLDISYYLRWLFYGILVILSVVSVLYCMQNNENRKEKLLRINLVASYIILVFIYDGMFYFSPTYAEIVTNYTDNAINHNFLQNILITDAGYLPLCQRLLTLLVYKIFKLSPYIGVYVLQIGAYLISGMIMSFFIKKEFSDTVDTDMRYMFCLILMMMLISDETGVFINFMTYGICILFLYFVVDSMKWSLREYILLCVWGCLSCLSKGVYVTILPFMLVCTVLFFKNYNKRDWIFVGVTSIGALLQLIYYLLRGVNWIDAADSGNVENYYLKLIFGILVDTPSAMLSIFTDKIDLLNGISFLLIIAFWIIFLYIFIKYVIMRLIKKENISRNIQLAVMMLIYIMAQSLFLRITVLGVSEYNIFSDEFWSFKTSYIGNRYQNMIFIAVFIIYILLLKIIKEKKGKKYQYYGMIILTIIVSISNLRLQIKGIGNDNYSGRSSYLLDVTAEVDLLKNIEDVECRVVPIQPNNWIYGKGANYYCFGDDYYNWMDSKDMASATDVGIQESTEPWTGKLTLTDYSNVNTNANIWQIFIVKNNLINNSNYKIVLYDKNDEVIMQKSQDNIKYQNLTSFTFNQAINNVAKIQVLDENEKHVFIQNTMYIVTDKNSPLMKK